MKVVISSGHGKYIRGASGYIDEVDEARKVVNRCVDLFEEVGVQAIPFHDNTSTSQDQNLHTIVNFHNSQTRDYDISVHFNAYETTSKPMGTECLYVTQSTLADKVAEAVSEAGDLIDRGPKKRTDLYFLNNTEEPSILIETCFVDSKADVDLYHEHFEDICKSIVEAVSGKSIGEQPPPDVERPPITRPPPETDEVAIGTVTRVPSGDTLNIRASASGSSTVIGNANNGDTMEIVGESGTWYKVEITEENVSVFGWVSRDYMDVTGEIPGVAWHEDITSTQFGGGGDEQEGAYGGYITGSTRGVALPYKWRDTPRPRITVSGPKGTVTVEVVDVGPWNIDDPNYVLGAARPLAETQYINGVEAQNGQVPTNDAGIDLTDPVAKDVGISGKGKVRWKMEEPQTVVAQSSRRSA